MDENQSLLRINIKGITQHKVYVVNDAKYANDDNPGVFSGGDTGSSIYAKRASGSVYSWTNDTT